MEIADVWPGRLLATSRGQVFVRRFDEQVDDGGIDLDAPPRPPVLFVHGLGGESLDWVDVAVQLKDSFDCSALDLPLLDVFGRGGSLKSSWYGDCLPSRDFPMLVDLYQQGRLDLDAFVSELIGIGDIEAAFDKMHRGEVLRSVVEF